MQLEGWSWVHVPDVRFYDRPTKLTADGMKSIYAQIKAGEPGLLVVIPDKLLVYANPHASYFNVIWHESLVE